MAITKERKQEFVALYQEWLRKSQAVILTEYTGLSTKDVDSLRAKIREVGGEFHVVKNTLGRLAFEKAGLPLPQGYFEGSTAIGFAFQDAPGLAKVFTDFAKTAEALKIKGGYLETRPITVQQINELAALPPLPVMRARLMGTILASANQLARTLAEPARRVAAVLKAYSEKSTATA